MTASRAHSADLVQEASRLVEELVLAFDQAYAQAAQRVGLSAAQACALATCRERRSMGELTQELGCDASNTSQVVARLEARGLLERRPSEDDRRVKLVEATPDGRALSDRMDEEFTFVRDKLGAMSAGEVRGLVETLRRLRAA